MNAPPCLLAAWSSCEAELRRYLRHRLAHSDDADELLQEVFIKAWQQEGRFCAIDDRRAWLFRVTRNALADRLRASREHVAIPEDLAAPAIEPAPAVDELSQLLVAAKNRGNLARKDGGEWLTVEVDKKGAD